MCIGSACVRWCMSKFVPSRSAMFSARSSDYNSTPARVSFLRLSLLGYC